MRLIDRNEHAEELTLTEKSWARNYTFILQTFSTSYWIGFCARGTLFSSDQSLVKKVFSPVLIRRGKSQHKWVP